ncbi:MAG: host-nuclease inhibitor Gam family protein [Nitrospiraceae bacterium]|nr:host-nuclease inhibitor Gam family protein [Nitrospiraceae bacterium]
MRKRLAQAGFRTWDEVDEALRQISIIELELARIEAQMNAKVMEIKKRAQAAGVPLKEKRVFLEAAMEGFASNRRADFGEKKHMALTFGVISFRLSTRLVISDMKRTVGLLKNLGLKNCIRVTEAPDKEKMAALDEETLLKAGARRKTEDVFGYEVDLERIGKDCPAEDEGYKEAARSKGSLKNTEIAA